MPHLIGPDFISIQVDDLDAARAFYTEVVGLRVAAHGPPGAVVFDTSPIPFAVRTPVGDPTDKDAAGAGVALWFGCDDADQLHEKLVRQGTHILSPPKDGPFGRFLVFRDPFGYAITCHTVARDQG